MNDIVKGALPPSLAAARQRLRAVIALLLCGLMLSTAGVVIRQLESAGGFEVTFWRSLGCLVLVSVVFHVRRGGEAFRTILKGGLPMLGAGVCWAVMFTCFSVAVSMTTVAKAMVLIALAPLLAALFAWLLLREKIPARTWLAIFVAGTGTVWMISDGLVSDPDLPLSNLGMLIAAGVPVGSAINFILLRKYQSRLDLIPSVIVGAAISCVIMVPFVFPVQASPGDIVWMLGLGVFQIGIPCTIIVIAAKYLAPQEVALLLMLEVVCAPIWVWIGFGERPADATLWGGILVILALVGNELISIRQSRVPKVMIHG